MPSSKRAKTVPKATRIQFTKAQLLSKDWEPPNIELMAAIFRKRYYTRELVKPKKEGEMPKLKLTCIYCKKPTISTWPINTTNLEQHIKKQHREYYKGDLERDTKNKSTIDISSNESSSNSTSDDENYSNKDNSNNEDVDNNKDRDEHSTNTIDTLSDNNNPSKRKRSRNISKDTNLERNSSVSSTNSLRHYFNSSNIEYKAKGNIGRLYNKRGPFDRDLYKDLVLNFLIANNLPLSLVHSKTFKELLYYLNSDARGLDRKTLSTLLNTRFESCITNLIELFSNINGYFALTIDEYNTSSNLDFLAITIHFYDNEFTKLHSLLIGFEVLNESNSYDTNLLYKWFTTTLETFNIQNRIMSISRDNASPVVKLVNTFKENYFRDNSPEIIDVPCLLHVLNLVTNRLLQYLFFVPNNTIEFKNIINTYSNEISGNYILFDQFKMIKALPEQIRNIITAFNRNHHLKNSLRRKLLNIKNNRNPDNLRPDILNNPEKLIRDNTTRWLSTWKMIDRFLYFQNIVNTILEEANYRSKGDTSIYKIDTFIISDKQWEYLAIIRDILKIFRKPTIKCQATKYSMISYSIITVWKLRTSLANYIFDKELNLKETYPLIYKGLGEALTKLNTYYPLYSKESNDFNRLKDLYIATILDPRYKLYIIRKVSSNEELIDKVTLYFNEVYKKYKLNLTRRNNTSNIDTIDNSNSIPSSSNILGTSFISINSQKQSKDSDSDDSLYIDNDKETININEVDTYLEERRSSRKTKIDEYWRLSKDKYPILFLIAKDYLAIPPTSVPSESTFSKVGDIVTKKRNRLLPDTIKKLIILKCLGIAIDEEDEINDNLDSNVNIKDSNSITSFINSTSKGKERAIDSSTLIYRDSSSNQFSDSNNESNKSDLVE